MPVVKRSSSVGFYTSCVASVRIICCEIALCTNMLADVSSVPAWKQALLERKRQHDEEARQKQEEEVKRLADMPAWKRNILGKKQQQKSSMVFLSAPSSTVKHRSSSRSSTSVDCLPCSPTSPGVRSPVSPIVVDDVFPDPQIAVQRTSQTETDDVAVAEEHISTVYQNPWFRSQGLRKKPKPQRTVSSPDYIYNSENRSSSISSDSHQKQLDQNDNYNMDNIDCADAEEVTYGKGFVHKLLEKFKHLTAKEQADMFSFEKKRTQSTDSVLVHDDFQNDRFNRDRRLSGSDKTDVAHAFDLSQKRAKSVDNLSLPLKVYDSQTPENNTETTSPVSSPVENGSCATSNGVSGTTSEHVVIDRLAADADVNDSVQITVPDTVVNGEIIVEDEQDTGTLRSIVLDRRSKFEKLGPLKPKRKAPLPPSPQPNASLDNPFTKNKVSNTEATQPSVDNHSTAKTVPEMVTSNNTGTVVVCNGVADQTEPDLAVSSSQVSQQTAKPEVSLPNIPSASKSWSLPGSKSDTTVKSQPRRDITDTPPAVTSPLSPNSSRSFLYRTLSNTEVRSSNAAVTKTASATKKGPQKDERTSDAGRQNLNLHLNGNSAPPHGKSVPSHNTTVFGGQAVLKKTTKRPASSGPGSLLIRPASNLVVGNSTSQYLKLNKYNDITKGEFAPANKKPSYYDDEYSDDEDDVPVTNIDDYLADDMPVTDIDSQMSPREGTVEDAPRQRKRSKFDFAGAGVTFGKNLLTKTPGRNVSSLLTCKQ